MQPHADSWDGGSLYERFMGRWSRPIAQHFLHWLGDVAAGGRWLDVGCGTGVLSREILAHKQPLEILAIDASADFIAFAREHHTDPRLRFEVALAQSIPAPSGYFDAAVSGLCLNFVPDPAAAVAEMRRVTKAGGSIAAYVWDYAEGMQMLRYFWDAAVALNPEAAALDEGARFPLCHKAALHTLFAEGSLRQVQATSIEAPTNFSSFDDYWEPFLGGIGPAGSYVMGLTAGQCAALRARLQEDLAVTADGAISMSGRAWAVYGLV